MLPLRVTRYAPGSHMAPHYHDEPSLIVVACGVYRERIEASETQHGAGSMLYYPAFAMHSQQFGAEGARKIVFTPPLSALEYLEEHGMRHGQARHVRSAAIAALAARLLREMRNRDEFAEMAIEGMLLELVAAFARGGRPDGPAAAPAWVRAARDLVRTAPEGSDSIAGIAARLGKHPVHLAREFRKYFGVSIGGYRRRLRVEKAAALLSARAMPQGKKPDLTEIALECGFASHSHLCRSFKALYGVTPGDYRSST